MENASKALLIAAAVLVVIIIIAFGIKIFNSSSDTTTVAKNTGKTINDKTKDATDSAISAITGKKANAIDYEINNGSGNGQQGSSTISADEQSILNHIDYFSSTYSNQLGGSSNSRQFLAEWTNLFTQVELDTSACSDIQSTLNSIGQYIISQNINSANEFDAVVSQVLQSLNSTCNKYRFVWDRDNSTRLWTHTLIEN